MYKLYWRNIFWNHTVRLWWLWKYRGAKFRDYYCAKLVQTEKELKEIETELNLTMRRNEKN